MRRRSEWRREGGGKKPRREIVDVAGGDLFWP